MIAQWRRVDHSNLLSTALDCGMDAPHFLYHMIIGDMPLFSSIVCIPSAAHPFYIKGLLKYGAF